MTLEEYIRREYGEGKIDFIVRAHIGLPEPPFHPEGRVFIYIHPDSLPGHTTPNLEVKGNLVVEP